jgi:hypothetical protein
LVSIIVFNQKIIFAKKNKPHKIVEDSKSK